MVRTQEEQSGTGKCGQADIQILEWRNRSVAGSQLSGPWIKTRFQTITRLVTAATRKTCMMPKYSVGRKAYLSRQ